MTPILNSIFNAMNMTINSVCDMQKAVSADIDLTAFDAIHSYIDQIKTDVNNLQETASKPIEITAQQAYTWNTDTFQVFTNTGIDRFRVEAQSAIEMMNRIAAKQQEIASKAATVDVLPPEAVNDLNNVVQRANALKEKINQIANPPLNPLDPNIANTFENMRQQLSQSEALIVQMNEALEAHDVERINTLYRQENSILNSVEQNIRDNVNVQGQFNSAVRQGTIESQGMGNMLSKVGSALGIYKIASVMKNVSDQAVDYASDLQEVQNVVDVTFASSAGKVDEWSANTLNAYGLNQYTAKQYSGTMGAMLKSSGITGDKISDMSMKITELSGDMASFYNLDSKTAFEKIRSGISGETEPLKQLGINMSVANLKAYAMSQGITTAYDKMSQAEQTLLRYNYLLSVTADAHGDFARTQDSYANQTKLLSENWQAFTGSIADTVLPKLAQIISKLNSMFASEEFKIMAAKMSTAINVVITTAGKLITAIQKVGAFGSRNWSMLSPVIMGVASAIGFVVTAYGIYSAVQFIHNIHTAFESVTKYRAAKAALAHATNLSIEEKNTYKATIAQAGFNTVLLASPVTWVVLGLIALIAVIAIVIAAIKKATNTTTSAFGMILGAVYFLGALICNFIVGVINSIIQFLWTSFVEPFIGIIEWIFNVCNNGFNSFGDMVANLVGNIISWFLSLGQVVTKIIDAIFGTNWTAGLEGLKNTVTAWGKNENAISISREAPKLNVERRDLTDAYNKGALKGDEISQSIKAKFGALSLPEDENNAAELSEIEYNTANTAADTSDIKDSVKTTSDDELEYLRKIAEREAVNKFTTAEVRLEFTSNSTINSELDLDGIINTFTDKFSEALITTANGLEG